MTETPIRRERKPIKTWSLLGDVKKVPSTYEVVTSKFHYHFRREPAPFELDPETPINKWYLQYREGSPVQVDDWEQFRDPARLTYRDYVSLQSQHETYLDHLIDQAEREDVIASLSPDWVETLGRFLIPMRFPLHTLQMTSLYVGQMAPSSFITNCANFQAADEMRRIQRLAYWTKSLSLAHGEDLATTAFARDAWEGDPSWQPLRQACEEMLATYDWAEAWVALDMAVKPAMDALLDWQFADAARAEGDEFLALMFQEFRNDAQRSADWTIALAKYALAKDEGLSGVLGDWADRWQPQAVVATEPLSAMLSGSVPTEGTQSPAERVAWIRTESGLG